MFRPHVRASQPASATASAGRGHWHAVALLPAGPAPIACGPPFLACRASCRRWTGRVTPTKMSSAWVLTSSGCGPSRGIAPDVCRTERGPREALLACDNRMPDLRTLLKGQWTEHKRLLRSPEREGRPRFGPYCLQSRRATEQDIHESVAGRMRRGRAPGVRSPRLPPDSRAEPDTGRGFRDGRDAADGTQDGVRVRSLRHGQRQRSWSCHREARGATGDSLEAIRGQGPSGGWRKSRNC